ncbi:DUF4972 domain-containing protein [Chitinophaga sp. GCM10012297]|uniref:DUF4972 domain-containing protein n=1 Tax=Chitinophaga chungangae TaxID=2821488 RepID=A0ABS3YGZ6_9BACT|nr:DUF4972 domain-containing protein [Chitinophaga chungangae]MBO9153965.1 DUF4972 domain-containing protein [Chitinophaga chungangae]
MKMIKLISDVKVSALFRSWIYMLLVACAMTGCTRDKEKIFITDTNLSILQKHKSNLESLLVNSAYGTAPGTYPQNSKSILTAAISKLETAIESMESGGGANNDELELQVAAVNQAIDAFKNSRLYNLAPEAQQFVASLKAKAQEFALLLNDEARWGNHKGQYPVESKGFLETATASLYTLVENILSGSVTNMTQALFDDAMQAAAAAMQKVEDSKWEEDNIIWNLFVDGNNGGYIDFGYSPDYVKFGDANKQAFTVELWVNVTSYCNVPGQDNSTFLSTMTQQDYWSGWRAQDRNRGLQRTMVAHWQDNGPSNPQIWEPGWKKSDNWTLNRWTHYAFLFRDEGLPGFDTPTDVKCYSMIDGQRQGEIIRVGERWRTYISDNSVKYQVHMTGFCSLDNNGNRQEAFSGYIKKIRIWKTNRTEEQVRNSYLGVATDVTENNSNLVAAWDFEVRGSKPAGTEITDLTGRHIATLKGAFKWVESTEVPQ